MNASDLVGRPIVAMIALAAPVLDRDRLATSLGRWIPTATSPSAESEGVLSFQVEDELAAIGVMPAPIPWSDLAGPCATAWYWPEATEAMQRHRAHLIVTLSGGRGDLVARHILLTRVVAATIEAIDAVGVYWGSGTVVHSPERFLTDAGYIDERNLPLDLWIDFRVQRLPDDTTRAFTTGLAAFGQMEIEVPAAKCGPEDV